MTTYVLKDPLYDSDVSKINNFTIQWSKWYPHVKISYYQSEFTEQDIIITNLYKGDPYGKHIIPPQCREIAIVHSLNKDIIQYLQNVDYIIYLNDLQRQITQEIVGIDKPHAVAPRHPLYEFNTDVKQIDCVYMGGWFFPDRTEGFVDKLKEMHRKFPGKAEFGIHPIWGKSDPIKNNIDSLQDMVIKQISAFDKRNIFFCKDELQRDMMIFKTRTCKYGALWNDGPTIEEIKDLVSSKDVNVLDYSIEESSMLALLQSSPKEKLIVDKRIKYLPFFEDKGMYTFKDFSLLLKNAIITLS